MRWAVLVGGVIAACYSPSIRDGIPRARSRRRPTAFAEAPISGHTWQGRVHYER